MTFSGFVSCIFTGFVRPKYAAALLYVFVNIKTSFSTRCFLPSCAASNGSSPLFFWRVYKDEELKCVFENVLGVYLGEFVPNLGPTCTGRGDVRWK